MSVLKPVIVALANQKGGVGKTTTAINLATALAACGKNVLLVDADPQGNSSTGVGITQQQRQKTLYDVLAKELPMHQACMETGIDHLFIVATSVELAALELELVDVAQREFVLRRALETFVSDIAAIAGQTFDYIFIDCPPALGLLTLNGLTAADYLLVPLQAEFYALEGLSNLLRTVEQVKERFNPQLALMGIVLTMYDQRNRLCQMVEQDVRNHLGGSVFETIIPRNVRISEAPSHGLPVILYDIRSTGARAYLSLASEFLQRVS